MKRKSYVARSVPNRRGWVVEFRHPLRLDGRGKPGRKVRKGLATRSRRKAQELVDQLNSILADPDLHAPTSRTKSSKRFDPLVVEIFYADVDGHNAASQDEKPPLPISEIIHQINFAVITIQRGELNSAVAALEQLRAALSNKRR